MESESALGWSRQRVGVGVRRRMHYSTLRARTSIQTHTQHITLFFFSILIFLLLFWSNYNLMGERVHARGILQQHPISKYFK